jgi:hypothetical protein
VIEGKQTGPYKNERNTRVKWKNVWWEINVANFFVSN